MRHWKAFPAVIGAIGLIVLGAAGADARPRPSLGGAAAPDSRVARHPGTGLVTFLPGDAGAAPAVGAPAAATAEGAARAFVAANAAAFGIADAGAELRLIREEGRPAGGTLVRYRQLVGGVPVFGGEVHVAVGADRGVRWASAETVAPGPIALEPSVDAAAAVAAAVAATAAKYALPESALAAGAPALEVYDDAVFTPELHTPGIVWRLEVTTTARPLRELVLVDARRGGVRLAFNRIDAARDLATYTMNHSSDEGALPGTFVCNEGDLGCAAGDADARGAHRYASDTYDYFLGLLGRDGIDGAGMQTVSSVHFGTGYANAFWNFEQMVYGDGWASADDVVGHELAHGVMQYTAGLFNWAESGAINESFSDMHGEFVDQFNGDADTPWLIGEDLPYEAPATDGAIRNMADPTQFGDPDRIGSPFYYTGLSDNAGVHYNAGVNNKAVYLIVQGDDFNGQSVAGIGSDKTAWLYYTVQSGCLTPASNYNDLATCLRAECDALAAEPVAGRPVLTAADCGEVRKALLAVAMDARPGQRVIDDSNAKMTFKGNWTAFDEATLYGTYHQSEKAGNTARVKFVGSRLAVHTASYGTGGGILDLYLDSTAKKIGSINQTTNRAFALHLTGLPSGTHTLIMKHTKGSWVNVDAVASSPKAVATPVFGAADFADGWAFYPWATEYMTYKGAWSVRPGWTAYSSKVGDTSTFSFTGNAYYVGYLVNSSNPGFGVLQIYRNDKLVKSINTQLYDVLHCGNPDEYNNRFCWYESTGLAKGKHTVRIKHSSGQRVELTGFSAYDLTQP